MKRVVVVDDSLSMRKYIVEALSESNDFEVVGEAVSGRKGIELVEREKPDVVTLDMMMPEMNGLEATEYIMANCPTPILIVSSSTNRGELMKTYDALNAGAVSVLEKIGANDDIDNWEALLLSELKIVSRVPVVRHLNAKYASKFEPEIKPSGRVIDKDIHSYSINNDYQIVCIGTSTGGPQALATLLSGLDENFPLPILCVLHIAESFTVSLPEWLSSFTGLNVVNAANHPGEIQPGFVYLAPPGKHMKVTQNKRIWLTDDERRNYCRPSVDILFESVAMAFADKAIGVILTGMGRDGADGLKKLYDAKSHTIAENETSCVVFGMPHAAIENNAVRSITHLNDIAKELTELTASKHAADKLAVSKINNG